MIDAQLTLPEPQLPLLHTSGLKHGQMLEAVRRYVSTLPAIQVAIEDTNKVACEWSALRCGECMLTHATLSGTSAVRVQRTAPARFSTEYFDVIRLRTGKLTARQQEFEVTLGADQFLLLRAYEPWEYTRHGGLLVCDMARVPAWLLRTRLGNTDKFLGRAYSCGTGLPALAMGFIEMLYQRIRELAEPMLGPLTAQLADLVALALTSNGAVLPHAESSVRTALLERLRHYIDRNLASRDLTPRSIALAHGISQRYVHRIFEDSGHTVGDYIRTQRVAACRRMLENPLQVRQSIAEVAFAHGFRSVSQLTRAYRQEFGVPPSVARRRSK